MTIEYSHALQDLRSVLEKINELTSAKRGLKEQIDNLQAELDDTEEALRQAADDLNAAKAGVFDVIEEADRAVVDAL